MTAISLRFLSVSEEDLGKVLNDYYMCRFILKQLDYSLSISMRDSWLGLRTRQLSRDRNLQLII